VSDFSGLRMGGGDDTLEVRYAYGHRARREGESAEEEGQNWLKLI